MERLLTVLGAVLGMGYNNKHRVSVVMDGTLPGRRWGEIDSEYNYIIF